MFANRAARARFGSVLVLLAICGKALAQTPSPAFRPPMPVCYQAVEFIGPAGSQVSFAANGAFIEPQPMPQVATLLVGPLYRIRVTGLPGEPGREVFPTIELLDRLCPPPGQELKFPVPLELNENDLRLALAGHFVTRVIYVEDPELALPALGDPEHPSWYDVGPGMDPLKEAKHLGRPIAIVRMGGRLPDDVRGADMQFLAGCPPVIVHGSPARQRPIATASTPAPDMKR